MSGALAISGAALIGDLVLLSPITYYRAIGPEAAGGSFPGVVFQADVTEMEEHRDQLYVTEHPVEVGASISDHAYKRPSEVQLRIAWSNSSHADPFYVQRIYDSLLRLQADRVPFNLYTGKRPYYNMLFSMLVVTTDPESEYALRVDATMHQILLAQTKQYSISTNPNNLADPSSALPTQQNGSKVLQSPNGLNTSTPMFATGGALNGVSQSSIGLVSVAQNSPGTSYNNPGAITPLSVV